MADNRQSSDNAPREGRFARLGSRLSSMCSFLALCIAIGTAAYVFLRGRSEVSASAIQGFNFSSPEDSLRSVLTMRRQGQFTALRSYDVAFNGAVLEEKLKSLKIHKTREHDGRRILFVSYSERGDTKFDTESYIRDADSGLWGPSRYSYYDVSDKQLAEEMRAWTEQNGRRI
ncbi:MAG: hypothetical protein SH850_11550 [Planctomycetaceae bacterium]|nr:hypothetical protein [Planctomycetaceae bacterium]